MYTNYDRECDRLVENLEECLRAAKLLLVDEDTTGYDEYPEDKKMIQYLGIKEALGKCLRGVSHR